MSRDTPGTIYLLHFSESFGHARHYTGWTPRDVGKRIADHQAGRGANLTRVAVAQGITLELARTWPGTPDRELQIKKQGGASRKCPLCGPLKRMYPNGYKKKEGSP